MVCSAIMLFSSGLIKVEGLVCIKMLLEDIWMGLVAFWFMRDGGYSVAGDLISYLF